MTNESEHGTGSAGTDRTEESLDKIRTVLEEILQQVKQQNRIVYHRDFSYARLIGSVAQLLVVGLLFWAIVGLVDLGEIKGPDATMLKFLGAVLLQLLALTFFFLDKQE